MRIVIESLPVLTGVLLSLFFKSIKPSFIKYLALVCLLIVSATIANLLSGEGIEFLYVDILLTSCGAFGSIMLFKYFSSRRIVHK